MKVSTRLFLLAVCLSSYGLGKALPKHVENSVGYQEAGMGLTYDIVSIKELAPDAHLTYLGARNQANGVDLVSSLRGLVAYTYGIRPESIQCAINWCDAILFSVKARVDESLQNRFSHMTATERAKMLEPTLVARFALLFRTSSKLADFYELERIGDARGLVPVPESSKPPQEKIPSGSIRFGDKSLRGYAATMMSLANAISVSVPALVDRPVEDFTGLNGIYNFEVRWNSAKSVPDLLGGPEKAASVPDESGGINQEFVYALREQLGLILKPARHKVPIVIVEKAQKPSAD